MEIKTVEDVVKAHNEFALRVQKRVEALSGGKASDVLAADKKEEVNLLRGKLKEMTAAREEVIRRYDEEIRRLKDTVSRLEKEIKGGSKGTVRSPAGTGRDLKRVKKTKPVKRTK